MTRQSRWRGRALGLRAVRPLVDEHLRVRPRREMREGLIPGQGREADTDPDADLAPDRTTDRLEPSFDIIDIGTPEAAQELVPAESDDRIGRTQVFPELVCGHQPQVLTVLSDIARQDPVARHVSAHPAPRSG